MASKATRGLGACIRRRTFIAAAAGVIASSMLVPTSARASSGTVLILGSSVFNGLSSDEAQAAISLGFSVKVVDGATWDSMATAQFSAYSALILGDPFCSLSPSNSVGAAESNASTWSAAVNGNVSVVGTDPVFHHLASNIAGALKVTTDAMAYALARPGTTGAYISLSCYYANVIPSTSVSVLSGLGTFFVHGNLTCSDSGHVEANIATGTGSWSNLTDADLLSWGCSIHETFDQWPANFTPLAIDPSATPATFTGSDGTPGQPYILVSGQGAACQPSFAASADSTKAGVTDLIGTCFVPGEKVDVLLNTEAGAVLVDQPTADAFGAIDDSFVLPAFFNIPLPNAKGFQSVTVPVRRESSTAPTVYQLDLIGEKADDGGRLQVMANADGALIPMEAKAATTAGPACVPSNLTAPQASAPTNLTTSGRWIVDQNQKRVKLASVNWYGAEQADFVVGGLQCQSIATIAAVVRNKNFNSVRLPFSNAMLEEDPGSCAVSPAPLEQPCIAPGLLLANPSLQGTDALGIYRGVIEALGKIGVMVVLDDHTTDAQWAPGAGNGIWWGGALWDDLVANANCPNGDSLCWHRRIALWKNDWLTTVNLFQQEGNVIGVDLRNEPDETSSYGIHEEWCGPLSCPTTGSPEAGPALAEWGPSAEWAGNAILSALPTDRQLLIFVEGLQFSEDLTEVSDHWLTLQSVGHLVYSPHSYPKFAFGTGLIPRQYKSLSASELANTLGSAWGYVVTQGQNFTAPVWVGEFGDCNLDLLDSCASPFRDNFIAYLKGADFDWAYWPINANYSDAGSSNLAQSWFATEPFGILNSNWSDTRKTSLIAKLPTACSQGPCP